MNFSLVLNFPRAEGVRSLRLANPADPTHINNATNLTTTTATTTKVPGNGGGTDPRSSINYVFFIIVVSAYVYVQLWMTTSLYVMIILWLCWFLYSKAKPWCIQCLCNKRKSLCYNFLFCILVSGSCSPRNFYFFTTVRQNLAITHCETVYATIIICLTM